MRSSNNFLDKFVAKFLREALLQSISFTSSGVSKSLEFEVEENDGDGVELVNVGFGGLIWLDIESVSESDGGTGVVGVTDDNQLVIWVDFTVDGKLVSNISRPLLLLCPGVTVRDVIDDVEDVAEDITEDAEGVNPNVVTVSLDINDAGIGVSGDIAFATIIETDLVSRSTLVFRLCKSSLKTLYFKLWKWRIPT